MRTLNRLGDETILQTMIVLRELLLVAEPVQAANPPAVVEKIKAERVLRVRKGIKNPVTVATRDKWRAFDLMGNFR